MSFLFPLYLLGAAAIAAPILLHLRKQPPKEHQAFSSLMFLQKSPEILTRRSRLERLFLLLLRCLALILLALMFTRPFFPNQEDTFAGEGAARVYLVDTSASMKRAGLWERTMEELERALKENGESDRVALATFDSGFDLRVSFEQWDANPGLAGMELSLNELKASGPGWEATDLGTALAQAANLLEDAEAAGEDGSAARLARKQIVVLSDFQEGAAVEALNQTAWPEDIQVDCKILGGRENDNFSANLIASMADDEDDDNEDAKAGAEADREPASAVGAAALKVRVRNSRESKVEDFKLAWEGAEKNIVSGFAPPGASRVVSAPPRADDSRDGVLVLSGDDHDFDNRLYVARTQPRPVSIIYADLGDSASSTDSVDSPYYYFERALQRTPAVEPVARPVKTGELSTGLEAADLLLLANPPDSEDNIEAVRAYLEDGGTALLLLRQDGDESKTGASQALSKLTGIEGIIVSEAKVNDYAMLTDLDFEHPLLTSFASAGIRDFTRIHVWKHRSVKLPEDSEENLQVIARYDSGDLAWFEMVVGEGSLIVFTSGWEPRESQLALSSKYVPLIYSVLREAGFSAARDGLHYVGDALPLGTKAKAVELPDGSEVSLQDGQTFFNRTAAPGFYKVDEDGFERVFAVNVAPEEGRLETMDLEKLTDLGVPMAAEYTGEKTVEEAAEEARRLDRETSEARQRIWQWVLIGVLVLLVIESWVASRRPRTRAPSSGAEAPATG